MKVIYLNVPHVEIFTAGPNEVVQLLPGRNVIDDDVYEKVLNAKDSALAAAIARQDVIVEGDRVDITKMGVQKAVGLIELETTIAGVEDLLNQEMNTQKPRKTITDAAVAKIEAIKKAEEEAAAEKKKARNAGSDNAQ